MHEQKENRNEPEVFLIPAYEYDPAIHNIEYRYLAPNTYPVQTGTESTGANSQAQDWERFYHRYYGRPRPFYPYYGYHPYYGGFHPYYGGYYHPWGYHYGWGYHKESSPSR